MGITGGEGSNAAGSRIFWGEGQGCGLEGMSTLGRNSFCGSDCRFLPPHLAPGTLSPPTSFLKQQKAVFLPGRSSLEPVPWRWKWQKKQDGERGWGWYPALVRLLLESLATVLETLGGSGWWGPGRLLGSPWGRTGGRGQAAWPFTT